MKMKIHLFSPCLSARKFNFLPGVTSTLAITLLAACVAASSPAADFTVTSTQGASLDIESLGEFDRPWAMSFVPNGQLLISEKPGRLWLVYAGDAAGASSTGIDVLETATEQTLKKVRVAGLPGISARGQGGLGDIVIHPQFSENQLVYISYVERDGSTAGAAVARARLDLAGGASPALENWEVIWRQVPKVRGEGHFGHRLAFSDDGHLFISSGERQKFDPAQDMNQNLGKIIRLNDDGSVPTDNPFIKQGGVAAQVWSLGHRNPLGMAFDSQGQLWVHEMGPRGGDELNRIVAAANYGYPLVSNGRHYSGFPIPDHDTRPEFQAPAITWTPVISPSSLAIYTGERYDNWIGSGLIGGLSSQSLVRVSLDDQPVELERFDMGNRIREVEQGPTGIVYLLEDKSGGRLLRLTPG